VMTMTTVGYGDVLLQTVPERLYACFSMLLGAVTFAYMLGNVQQLMSSLDTRTAMVRTRMDSISAFMRHRQLSPELQSRVRSYFSFVWSRQAVYDESSILEELPAHLRREVALEMHRMIISRVPFLKGSSDVFIAEMVTRMRPVQASIGDLIIRAGEVGSEMFIIDFGRIEILAPSWTPTSDFVPGDRLHELGPGEFFGEIAVRH
jgi:voltage-gated potassium channel